MLAKASLALQIAQLTFTQLAMPAQAGSELNERHDKDPDFAPVESQFLDFPMLEKDYWHWGSTGSAVFLWDKVAVAPEASNRKGLIHTMQPNPQTKHWYALLDFNIGRDKVKDLGKSGDGLGIYYVRNFDSGNPEVNQNFYGFVDDFDGIGVFINTLQTRRDPKNDKKRLVSVSSFANDGKKMLKQNSPERTCYRELTGNHLHFSKIAIEYEHPMLTVQTYDHDSQQFLHCFAQELNLDFEGFFVISASSGTIFPQYNFVNSFKVFDPTTPSTNHRFQDSHARKAEHDHFAENLAGTVADLIHVGAVDQGEEFEDMSADELRNSLAVQQFYLNRNFDYTNHLLETVGSHFQHIMKEIEGQDMYDHNVSLNQDLFQTYFNMSVTIATEINYLERKDEELDEILALQVSQGDNKARDRRRKGSVSAEPIEVNNRDTQRMIDSLTQFKKQLDELRGAVQQLTDVNGLIQKKGDTVDRILKENADEKRVRRTNDRDAKVGLIKQKIDFSDVEDIFDDVIDEELKSGVFFSTINLSMVCVMGVSAYLWFKLDKLDRL